MGMNGDDMDEVCSRLELRKEVTSTVYMASPRGEVGEAGEKGRMIEGPRAHEDGVSEGEKAVLI